MDLSLKKKLRKVVSTGEGEKLHVDGENVRYKGTFGSLIWVSEQMVVPLSGRENVGKAADFVGKITNSILDG